jgi:uncharacterized membrane protein
MSKQHLLMLLALAAIWGASFKASAPLVTSLGALAAASLAMGPARLARRRARISADTLRP